MSTPIPRPAQHIIKLKDDTDMQKHIQTFNGRYNRGNQLVYKVTHRWNPEFVNAYVGEFSAEVLQALKDHPEVDYISENSEIGDFDVIDQKDNNGNNNAGWGLSRINQAKPLDDTDSDDINFPYKYDGSLEAGVGVDIYILDKTNDDKDDDEGGHGTHVAGIAAGSRWGVAKAANLIAVKVSGLKHGILTRVCDQRPASNPK
ncbi:hypothetical protein CVT25_014410 [Psilocybe cyanescens]|uniref:Peptidase S8/S53 domain-containing protein n=1 Tax=Psilocybe cyanescens TaxID=93625 RepID=A0A409XIF3_PSICY|nr:hypothetical protein CVT25_014410 [Psilocybe cyanescens]